MERNAEKFREIQRNVKKCREMQRNVEKFREIQRNSAKCRDMQRNAGKCREMKRSVEKCRDMQRNAEKYRETRSLVTDIRFRQGSSWQPWRRTGVKDEGSVQEAFELEENEAVVGVRTNTDDRGWLGGLEVTTSTGRQVSWGDLDRDFYQGQKRRSVVENAKLGFCSGLVAPSLGDLDRSITFHWIMD